jgi:hypothetical protein
MKLAGLLLLAATLIAGAWLADAWLIMILVSFIHTEWWPLVPPIRYSAALAIASVYMINVVLAGAFKAMAKARWS